MSRDDNYPEDIRQYDNDPRSPNYNDPTESAAFEEMKDTMSRNRVADINGYFIESFGESTDKWLRELSRLVLDWGDVPSDRTKDIEIEIGMMIAWAMD